MITYQDIKSGAVPAPVGQEGLYLAAIQIDGGTQSRATLNQHVVDDYAEAIQAGATFPPIVVFYDGKKHWLADGFHRFHAYQKAGREKVAADVRQGTRRDAILHSVGANETHGLRRTNDDKRRAVLTLLGDAEWSKWSDNDIRQKCHVSLAFVQKERKDVTYRVVSEKPAPPPPVPAAVKAKAEKIAAEGGTPRFYNNKHGKVGVMNVAGINASRTQFQAKASEDNGSITGGAGAVTGEASRPASGRTDAGEAATVDLPTISEAAREADEIVAERNIFDELVALWKQADAGVRQDFKAYITGSEFVAKFGLRQEASDNTGGVDVDRSATRASSAVEVGATNSPDGADSICVGSAARGQAALSGECPEAPSRSAEKMVISETAAADRDAGNTPTCALKPRDDLTVGTNSRSAVPTVEAVAGIPHAPLEPPATANPFNNPRCQHPETCHLAHSRNECFDCNVAWSKRPKDEQVRLWAEAVQAARAA